MRTILVCQYKDIIKAREVLVFQPCLACYASILASGILRDLSKGLVSIRVLIHQGRDDFIVILLDRMLELGNGLINLPRGNQDCPVLIHLFVMGVL